MALTDNLKEMLKSQKDFSNNLEKEISQLDRSNLVAENNSLKEEVEDVKKKLDLVMKSNQSLIEENKILKNTVYEQIFSEKSEILRMVNKKVSIYFQSNVQGGLNRLKEFENNSVRRINEMTQMLVKNNVDASDEVFVRLNEVKQLLDKKLYEVREQFRIQQDAAQKKNLSEYEILRAEGVSEEEIKAASKKNNIENLIGLNIVNKLGILFLIIGVIAALQFTFVNVTDLLKGILAFVCGIVILGFGEFMNRKGKSNVFSIGLTSGGIAVLLVALAYSYFGLKIMDMYLALALSVLITIGAFLLSQRYNSQVIATFALVGGYLPIFSIAGSKTLVYGAMIYFVLLNLFALLIAFKKKWRVATYIGFALNFVGSFYIMGIMLPLWRSGKEAAGFDEIITVLYVFFAFVIYSLIPVASTYFTKVKMAVPDFVLLTINTYASAIILYVAFFSAGLGDFRGALAIAFSAVYLGLAFFVRAKMKDEKNIKNLFFITAFVFSILTVPFQFGKSWLTIGWLFEGVCLAAYGILRDKKIFQRYGFISAGLGVAAFLMGDIMIGYILPDKLFFYKYLAITTGSIIILACYMYRKTSLEKTLAAYKYLVASNFWVFMLYVVVSKLFNLLEEAFKVSIFNKNFIMLASCIVLSMSYAYVLPRIKILYDRGIRVISTIISISAGLTLFIVTGIQSPVKDHFVNESGAVMTTIIGTVILVVLGLVSVLSLRDWVKAFAKEGKIRGQWIPLIISGYFVFILTQNLIAQYNLQFSNFVISLIYLVTAFAWIVYGFIKRYPIIRRAGLGLAILSIAKLFIVDLANLTKGYEIISYFAFGIMLLAISFVYQRFSKKLLEKGEEEHKADNV